MITFHPDIFPFNIAVVRASELEGLGEFTFSDGSKIKYAENALGMAVKAIRTDKDNKTSCPYSMIIFKDRPSMPTIAHEAAHSAFDLLENIGISHKGSTDEVYAYTIGYITGCITTAINKDSVWE